MLNYVLGLDFGTCYSFPAIFDSDLHEVISLLSESLKSSGLPSVFYYKDYGIPSNESPRELVGADAEHYVNDDDSNNNAVTNVKGTLSVGEVSYKLGINIPRVFSNVYIIAHILGGILANSNYCLENEGLEPCYKAVVAVPCSFGIKEKFLLRKAAEELNSNAQLREIYNIEDNFEIVNFIKEPVAAALAYLKAKEIPKNSRVLVYDLGGGTFDLTLMEPSLGQFSPYREIASDGICSGYAGNDFDRAFSEYFEKLLYEQYKTSLTETIKKNLLEKELLKRAKEAKEKLSECKIIDTNIGIITDTGGRFFPLKEITRAAFESKIATLLEKTISVTKSFINANNLQNDDKLFVILVGGSSFIPKVKEELIQLLPKAKIRLFKPNKAIAHGAAVFAHDEKMVVQRSPFSYGVAKGKALSIKATRKDISKYLHKKGYANISPNEYNDLPIHIKKTLSEMLKPSEFEVLNVIRKGDELPTIVSKTILVATGYDMAEYTFDIYQNQTNVKTASVNICKKVGVVTLHFDKPLLLFENFLIEMKLDKDGMLEVWAVRLRTGKKVQGIFDVT